MKTIDKVLIVIQHQWITGIPCRDYNLNINQKDSDCFYQAIQAYNKVNKSFELGVHVDNDIEFSKFQWGLK